MSVRKADGSRLTKTQLQALTTAVPAPPAKVTVNETVYQDYKTDPKDGGNFETERKILFHAGQEILASDLDALFPAATFSSITPATGPAAGGTDVTIKGTNLSGTSGVTIGGVAATNFKIVDDSTITCTTPAHAAGAADVVVQDDAADVTATGAYTFA